MQRRIRAFTLIELLVVVAIITLLIAILLPSLGKARENAKRTACVANMHGISQALNVYNGEYNALPPASLLNVKSAPTKTVPSTISTQSFFPGLWRYHSNNGLVMLNPLGYITDVRAFYCPSSTFAGYHESYGKTWLQNGGTWLIPASGNVNGQGQYFGYTYQLHSVQNPYLEKNLISGATGPGGLVTAAYNKMSDFPSPNTAFGADLLYTATPTILPHGDKGNMLNVWFADGHAATLSGTNWVGITISPTAWSQSVVNAVNALEQK